MKYGAFREILQYDTVRIAASEASSVEVREFSSGRSVVLGVVIAAGAATAAVLAFNSGGNGGNPPGPDPGPPAPALVVSGSLLSAIWGLIGR